MATTVTHSGRSMSDVFRERDTIVLPLSAHPRRRKRWHPARVARGWGSSWVGRRARASSGKRMLIFVLMADGKRVGWLFFLRTRRAQPFGCLCMMSTLHRGGESNDVSALPPSFSHVVGNEIIGSVWEMGIGAYTCK